jgi:hypothetical protein
VGRIYQKEGSYGFFDHENFRPVILGSDHYRTFGVGVADAAAGEQ